MKIRLLLLSICMAGTAYPSWQSGSATDQDVTASMHGMPPAQSGAHEVVSGDAHLVLFAQGHGSYFPENIGKKAAEQALEGARNTWITKKAFADESTSYAQLLTETFATTHRMLCRNQQIAGAGTGLLSLLCLDDRVMVCHVGMVRAVMSRGGMAVSLSFDHTPDRLDECDRIRSAGQEITLYDGRAHANEVPFSRTLGAPELPAHITATPEVGTVPLTQHDEHIIIASGIWSVLDNHTAVHIVREELASGATEQEAARELVRAAKFGQRGATGCAKERLSAVVMTPARRRMAAGTTALFAELSDLVSLDADKWLTTSVSLYPVVASVLHAQGNVGLAASQLRPITLEQQAFMRIFMPQQVSHTLLRAYYTLEKMDDHELSVWASSDKHQIDAALSAVDCPVTVQGGGGPHAVYAASMLAIAVKWRHKGLTTKMRVGNVLYDAVCMNKAFTRYQDADHEHPIFAVYTHNNDIVCLTKADAHRTNMSLLGYVTKLQRDMKIVGEQYDELVFPMVDFADAGSVQWLAGLGLGDDHELAELVQYTTFKMNQHGAHAPSIPQTLSWAGGPKVNVRSYTINEPFFCWVWRPGMRQPLFASYIAPDQWKDPGNLADQVGRYDVSMTESRLHEK